MCRDRLESWNSATFPNFGRQKAKIRRAISALEKMPRSPVVERQMWKLEDELVKIENDEENYWKQRSRPDWLKEADKNTNFFHKKASAGLVKRRRNMIRKLHDDSSRWYKGTDQLFDCFNNYYGLLFSAGDIPTSTPVLDVIPSTITMADNDDLLLWPVDREEVVGALKQMGRRKAPGVDGLSAFFFRKYWDIIGDTVVQTVTAIIEKEEMPMGLNHTLIALIPKVKQPKYPKEFRPISLCNILYKIAAKVLANRLKLLLNKVISQEHSAFVPGRFITDNVMVAFECFHSMKKKKKTKGPGVLRQKLIWQKHMIELRHFLAGVMRKMGFAERWVRVIMLCVSSFTYSTLINGHQSPKFAPSRGLQQGDPLSPYLFLLRAEVLSAYTSLVVREKRLHGFQPAIGASVVSHFFPLTIVYFLPLLRSRKAMYSRAS
ncbi:unnamed protein product [Linum trigynum]|uniref:Reverse transcriptase domain-containing protein n=1 Tax=Linum trigynum TaxID=586398 RepID=A0AAV2GF31_9ROSI